MNIQLTLAARYLSGRKLRTFLTTLAIVFGVLVIFGMNTLLPAFTSAFKSSMLAAVGQVDATITLKTSDTFDQSEAGKVAGVEGVRAVSGYLDRAINLPVDYADHDPNSPDALTSVSIVGIDPEVARNVHAYQVLQGKFLEPGDTNQVVISKSLADTLGLQPGSTMTLPTPTGEADLTVVGILPAQIELSEEVLMTLSEAQAVLSMPGKINTIEANFDPSVDNAGRAQIESRILSSLGPAYQLGGLDANSELLNNLSIAQIIFNVLGGLALLMGGFIIFNTFRTLVAERRRDIGMLRALGANRSTIFGVILTEGLIQGVVGTTVGLLLGWLLGMLMVWLVTPIVQQFMNIRIGSPEATPGLIIGSIVLGVGITLLAGLLPAISASKATPLEALRPAFGSVSFRRLAGASFWIGLILIVLAAGALLTRSTAFISLGGILFITGLILAAPALINPIANLFGSLLAVLFARSGTAELAEGNLSRQPTRAAITASTTLIGMAILVMLAALFSSMTIGFGKVLKKSLGSDYLLIPPAVAVWGSDVGAGAHLAKDLRNTQGVAVVSTLRYAPTQVDGMATSVLGIDPAAYPSVSGLTFSKGNADQAYTDLAKGRYALINAMMAANTGIQIGDTINLATPNGTLPYQVVAIGTDYLNTKIATVYISQANIEQDFGKKEDVLLQMNLEPGADRAAVESRFKTLLKSYPQFRLVSGKDYIDQSMQLFNKAFAAIFALGVFLAVPSLIAMVNTLAIGVIERTREIGMLRAVGATRKQVRTIIIAEAIILSAIGTAFGILAGLYLGYMGVEAIRSAGFPMVFTFPWTGVLVAVSAGLIFGALAAIIPARQAARMEIVQALRYE